MEDEGEMLSRRQFMRAALRYGTLAAAAYFAGVGTSRLFTGEGWGGGGARVAFADSELEALIQQAPRARFWTSPAARGDCFACHQPAERVGGRPFVHKSNPVKCLLCPHNCIIADGKRGACRARINVGGKLRSLVYGRPIAIHIDPIEKKPFYHYLPGAFSYSLATSGCPLQCKFCQNWQISQASPEDYHVSPLAPADIAAAAASRRADVIAFTYNEPTVFAEYLLDIAHEAKKRQLRSVLVSCGFINRQPLAEMCELLGAIKIDLKGYSEEFYRRVCNAELRPVLRSISQVQRSKVHLEIVNLVVPTLNDGEKMLRDLIEWVAGELGPDVPLHFTRFQPDYQLRNLPPTPVETLARAREMALAKGIHYAYVGNVPNHPGNHTYCPGCRKIVIERQGFFVTALNMRGGRCASCGTPITGVWS